MKFFPLKYLSIESKGKRLRVGSFTKVLRRSAISLLLSTSYEK